LCEEDNIDNYFKIKGMKKSFKLLAAAVIGIVAVSCSSAEKMAEQAENVKVTCDPEVLEVIAGNIDATLTVTYPDGYFNPKATLKVTPVLVYEGGEAAMEPLMFQGEKVKDNYKVVSSDGGTVTEKVHFTYVPGMEKAYLELRGVASIKKKSVNLPVKKVADGCNTTYMLVKRTGFVSYKADNYQEVIPQTAEGQILYTINSSDVRGSQIKGASVKDFQKALDEIKDNERKTLKGTEVVAYASPDGPEASNNKLSDKRAASAEKAWKKVVKGHEASDPEVKSVGEDWEGFKSLVNESNIEDKDLILRVLSMYSDPAVRESEIKNMSEVYKELKTGILPELRRARFIANVEYQNYTKEELMNLIEENIDVLDEEALLRAASLVDTEKKVDIYKKAISKYDSERAKFNLAVAYANLGKDSEAASAVAKCANDADVENLLGVLDLRKDDIKSAAKHFAASGNEDSVKNMGVVDILSGNYAKAASELANVSGCCHNTVLAYILNGQIDKAAASAKCSDAPVQYLRAIIAARQGKAADAKAYLAKTNDKFKARAAKDVEFAGIDL
jgi:outer membrane protein OmpA-like peptidoglycan-associated protein